MNDRREDPAERSGYLRYFYSGWRPTLLGKMWSRTYAWVAGLGLLPAILVTLQVRNRNTGKLYSTILVGAEYQGQRYLVSMLGDGSEWVRDAHAASGRAFIKRGRARPVVLIDMPVEVRGPILKAWAQVATSGRKHLPIPHDAPAEAFDAIAQNYPVFRIDPED